MTTHETMQVFDRALLRRRRDRAARREAADDFLFARTGEALADRLEDVRRDFPDVLDLGCRTGGMARLLAGRKGVRRIIQLDPSPAMAARARETGWPALAADEEALPLADGVFDLAIGNLSLHWVNDLPGALLQLRRVLRPDGLLLAAMLGGDTLWELRQVLMEAELAMTGGVSPRLSPVADIRDVGGLLQRAGFALPVVDGDRITATYENVFSLFADLRGMGETNATLNRNPLTPKRALWAEVARRYQAAFADGEGRIPATLHVITLTGWAPHDSQQQALRPGAAKSRLASALGTVERPAGDKARPR